MNDKNTIIELYELQGKNDIRFSPPCWTIKLCIWKKGLQFKTIPIGFSEKDKIKFSGQNLVPLIKYNNEIIFDSWNIICWLDKRFYEKKLFQNDQTRSFAHFLHFWTQRQLQPLIFQMIGNDIKNILTGKDLEYYIQTREQRIGKPLSSLLENRDNVKDKFIKILSPVRKVIEKQNYLNGNVIGLTDFILFGVFIWAEKCSPYQIIESDDKLTFWYESIKNKYDIK